MTTRSYCWVVGTTSRTASSVRGQEASVTWTAKATRMTSPHTSAVTIRARVLTRSLRISGEGLPSGDARLGEVPPRQVVLAQVPAEEVHDPVGAHGPEVD